MDDARGVDIVPLMIREAEPSTDTHGYSPRGDPAVMIVTLLMRRRVTPELA